MKIIIKIGESQLPLQVKDEYEKELCFKAQKIINDKLLAYSRVYYTTEETVLFKILLFDSVIICFAYHSKKGVLSLGVLHEYHTWKIPACICWILSSIRNLRHVLHEYN